MKRKLSVQQGFSLLEILVAFSILALSLGVLLNIFSSGLRRTMISEEYQQAIIIAQSKLAIAGIELPLQTGEIQGQVGDKFIWQLTAQVYNIENLTAEKLAVIPFQVTVTVEWQAGENNRQVRLTTIKLAQTE